MQKRHKQTTLNFAPSSKKRKIDDKRSILVADSDSDTSESGDSSIETSDGESEPDDSEDSDFELPQETSTIEGISSGEEINSASSDDLDSEVEESDATDSTLGDSDSNILCNVNISEGEDSDVEIIESRDLVIEPSSNLQRGMTVRSDVATLKKGARNKRKNVSTSKRKVTKEAAKKLDPRKEKRSGRRNIKKLIADDSLAKTTKAAEKAEADRLQRLEHQKNITRSIQDSKDVDGVCLNPYRVDGEKGIYVCKLISEHLKPHQIDGLRFIWDNCVESVERVKAIRNSGTGCIMAHLMGLGKTLLCISFLEAFLTEKLGKCVIAIVPVNVLHNWAAEMKKWLPAKQRPRTFTLTGALKSNYDRLRAVKKWEKKGGLLILGYEMFRNMMTTKRGKIKTRELLQKILVETPDLLIADEGHRIKSEKSGLSKALSSIRTSRRIVLTGTPLQNNLLEYFFMVDFVRPNYLGTIKEFRNRFETPINNGQCKDSTPHDVTIMKERTFVLHHKLKGFVHRRDYSHMDHQMPVKHDYAIFVQLSAIQKKLYRKFLAYNQQHKGGLFTAYHQLMKVWNHPDALVLFRDNLERKKMQQTRLKYVGNNNDDDYDAKAGGSRDAPTIEKKSDLLGYELIDLDSDTSCANDFKSRYLLHKWWDDLLEEQSGYQKNVVEYSGKALVVLRIVEKSLQLGDKVVIFSQSLFVLSFLEDVMDEHLNLKKDRDVLRIDGSIPAGTRQKYLKRFNVKLKNSGSKKRVPRVFLVSTKAGCLGVNLSAANRVIVFDVSWNPSNDIQAVCRAYRYGQEKDVFVYRLVASGTMEQKIYERQMIKQGLALRVVDEYQVDRMFDRAEVDQLYRFEETTEDLIVLGDKKEVDEEWVPRGQRDRCNGVESTPLNISDCVLLTLLEEFGSVKLRRLSQRLIMAHQSEKALNFPLGIVGSTSVDKSASNTNVSASDRSTEKTQSTSSLTSKFSVRNPWIMSFDQPQAFLENVENEKLTKKQEQEALKNYELALEQEKLVASNTYLPYIGGYPRLLTPNYKHYGSLDNILLINRHALGMQRSSRNPMTTLVCPLCTCETKTPTPTCDYLDHMFVQCNTCRRQFNVGPPIYDESHPPPQGTIPGNVYINCPFCDIQNTFPKPANIKIATIACGGCHSHFKIDIDMNSVIKSSQALLPKPNCASNIVNPVVPTKCVFKKWDYSTSSGAPRNNILNSHQTPLNGSKSGQSESQNRKGVLPMGSHLPEQATVRPSCENRIETVVDDDQISKDVIVVED